MRFLCFRKYFECLLIIRLHRPTNININLPTLTPIYFIDRTIPPGGHRRKSPLVPSQWKRGNSFCCRNTKRRDSIQRVGWAGCLVQCRERKCQDLCEWDSSEWRNFRSDVPVERLGHVCWLVSKIPEIICWRGMPNFLYFCRYRWSVKTPIFKSAVFTTLYRGRAGSLTPNCPSRGVNHFNI